MSVCRTEYLPQSEMVFTKWFMLPLDKVERTELVPDFEIIYDREKVKNIPSAFLIVRCISTLGNPLSSFSVSKPMVLNKKHRLCFSKTQE
jgi:hypothetical protein